MGKKLAVLAGFAFMAVAMSVQAEVKMSNVFGSNMVLQREKNVPVWGLASPNEKVTVKFNSQVKETAADSSGRWQIALDPMQAGGPFKMEVRGGNTLAFDNILVGEVWICSGQSNMQMSVKSSNDSDKEIAAAAYPEIRLFSVPLTKNDFPQGDVKSDWKVCSPETIPAFSAAAYFFGREINRSLKVPVGLINTSWGGTRIEPWTPPAGFKSVPELKNIANQVDLRNPASEAHKKLADETVGKFEGWIDSTKKAIAAGQLLAVPPACPPEIMPYENNQQPTVLYNAMIHPLVPMSVRGALWYQGESNRGEGMLYFNKMQALINGWRTVFQNKDMAFYFVQLAPYNYGNNPMALAEIWEAQVASLSIPDTGMAVTLDIGNVKNIHPTNKQEVGHRLALLALNKTYGQKNIVCDSPLLDNVKIDGSKAVITFKNAVELKTRDGKTPDWFEICDESGAFKKADAIIQRNTVILSAAGIEKPLVVRFAWDHVAEPNLVNEAGLPASAFRFGKLPSGGKMASLVPESKDYKLAYELNPVSPQMSSPAKILYQADKRQEISGEIVKIAYYLELTKADASTDYVFVSMDPFTKDISKIGVPDLDSKVKFQQKLSNIFVKSNVAGVKNGTFAEGGYVEFWGTNYGPGNTAAVPGASATLYDFGDSPSNDGNYGSMQIHNYVEKQTVLAFNHWVVGAKADLGIGNSTGPQPDWTFFANAAKYASGKLLILVQTK
ncbi:MAG: sialate O-acetylesterase [Victivallales bacterium]|jgi:sialate O-acetylesterase